MCLYPKLILNPKYKCNKKNGGNIPELKDKRVKYVPIGCQNCMECRKQKARGWQCRLLEDIKTHANGKFITLTFSDEWITKIINGWTNTNGQKIEGIPKEIQGYDLDNEIATRATRWFNERWRKKHKTAIRHWLVTELGHNGTENIHLHGIIWTNKQAEEITKIWQYGYTWTGEYDTYTGKIINYVNERTINYIIKYINKTDEQHTTYRAKVLTSPGIGKNYTHGQDYKNNLYTGKQTREYYRTRTGHKIAMPIYWRNKIYTEQQREQLWLFRLDKNERWINGEKVSIAKDYNAYNALLKWHQQQNVQLGYGTDDKNWEKQQYERERRQLMIKTRILNTNKKTDKEVILLSKT